MSIELVPPGSDVLNQTAEPIMPSEIETPEVQAMIDDMLDIANGEQGNPKKPTMVGLAAPQVGLLKRIIIVGVDAEGMGEKPELRAYVNPDIVRSAPETMIGREGCYSTSRVCGIVERSSRVTIRAFDRLGNHLEETYEGWPARIFQHEIDHLKGIRFPDRITDDSRLHWVEEEEFGEYRRRTGQIGQSTAAARSGKPSSRVGSNNSSRSCLHLF